MEYDIWLDEPLRNIGDTYDELNITDGKVSVIRRIGVNEELNSYVLDTETMQELTNTRLKTFDKDTYIYIKEYEFLNYYCKYITDNDYADIFATQGELDDAVTELYSSITQTEKEINMKVSEKVGKSEIISEINQTSEEVKIKANKIAFEGTVTANEKFRILEDGSMEAVDGTFRGNIYMDNGNKIIGGDGMLTNLQFSSMGRFEGYSLLGFNVEFDSDSYKIMNVDTSVDIYIPDNFTIKSAYLTVEHTPVLWEGHDYSQSKDYKCSGYARAIKLYRGKSNFKFYMGHGSEYSIEMDSGELQEVVNAFGENSYTPSNTSGTSVEIKSTIDIKDYIEKGNNKLILRTVNPIPVNIESAVQQTGMVRAFVSIFGYSKLIEEVK